jgi:hypothetical protein
VGIAHHNQFYENSGRKFRWKFFFNCRFTQSSKHFLLNKCCEVSRFIAGVDSFRFLYCFHTSFLPTNLRRSRPEKLRRRLKMGNTTISSLVELWSTSSADDIQSVIRAVCKQMLGNPHVIDRERLTIAASQLLERSLSVRDTDQIQWLNRTAGKIFSIPKVI